MSRFPIPTNPKKPAQSVLLSRKEVQTIRGKRDTLNTLIQNKVAIDSNAKKAIKYMKKLFRLTLKLRKKDNNEYNIRMKNVLSSKMSRFENKLIAILLRPSCTSSF